MNSKKPDEALSDKISAALEGAQEYLSDPEAIKEAASNAAESVAEYIRKHPYQTVGAAFAVGLLAGLYLNKRK
jgi:ElaB/YqjD/DUF883 family membrane-anchored ribosome-binding protein